MNKLSPRPTPPEQNLSRVGSQPFETHIKRGYAILEIIEKQLVRFGKPIESSTNIYDFACGIGRVTIPLLERHEAEIHCSDVDHTAIDFLNSHYSSRINAITTNYEPPVPFANDHFDIVYSISLWSHLPQKLQLKWLGEMQRITKPGGLVLITTAGEGTLENWLSVHNRVSPSVAELVSSGSLFVKNERLEKDPSMFPGVTDDWGVFYQTPDYIRKNWSEFFTIEEILERQVGKQELVVLRAR